MVTVPAAKVLELFSQFKDKGVRYVLLITSGFSETGEGILNVSCEGKATPERGWNAQLSDYVWGFANRVAKDGHVLQGHAGDDWQHANYVEKRQ